MLAIWQNVNLIKESVNETVIIFPSIGSLTNCQFNIKEGSAKQLSYSKDTKRPAGGLAVIFVNIAKTTSHQPNTSQFICKNTIRLIWENEIWSLFGPLFEITGHTGRRKLYRPIVILGQKHMGIAFFRDSIGLIEICLLFYPYFTPYLTFSCWSKTASLTRTK